MQKILILEDDIDQRQLLTEDLSNDYLPIPAKTPVEALQLMEQWKFDLIISDFKLPGHDGHWFLNQVRARGHDTPFIMVTAHLDVCSDEKDCIVIQKPWDPGDFSKMIAHHLQFQSRWETV